MWSTIANLKENLNQIANDVHDAAEELEIYHPSHGEDSSVSDRRTSHRFAQTKSPLHSPVANGTDSGYKAEIERYKVEIQRLQASEAEIKALSVNYAALLKEKEEQLSRLHDENGSLRQNLGAANATRFELTNNLKTLTDSPNMAKRLATQVNNRSTINQAHNSTSLSNGSASASQYVGVQHKVESERMDLEGNEKELADLLEENKSLMKRQAKHESEIKQLKIELNKEREDLASIQQKLLEEQKVNGSLQKKFDELKWEKNKISTEMKGLQNELNGKTSEISQLQSELNKRGSEEEADQTAENLKRVITTLEKEIAKLKIEKGELEAALNMGRKLSPVKISTDDSDSSAKHSSNLDEVHSSSNFPGKEEMEVNLQKLEKDMMEARRDRDKALQELNRLKQHLLDKELEESDKMDEDSKIIEELQAKCDYQRAQILQLEKALKNAIESLEEVKKSNSNKLLKSEEMINDLKQKLASCMSTLDAKNVELLNLQTALGQYYAESEAKERLERDLILAREGSAKLSDLLKDANQKIELSKQEKEEILAKLSQAEKIRSEGNHRVHKLEEDNMKLRRALEQSMTRINRMSMDSDYFVDRRIVIKLLVTYFQRNHSKEVLDLMVRMLGFSEEEKQRIGIAQQSAAGKGVVRGVFGLPGRLVGGILGGSSSAHAPSENQSFADLWVDFLLKENEERERRGSVEAPGGSSGDTQGKSPTTTGTATPVPDHRTSTSGSVYSFSSVNPSINQKSQSPFSSRGNALQSEHSDTEFSTVPLTSSVSPSSANGSRISRLLPRY